MATTICLIFVVRVEQVGHRGVLDRNIVFYIRRDTRWGVLKRVFARWSGSLPRGSQWFMIVKHFKSSIDKISPPPKLSSIGDMFLFHDTSRAVRRGDIVRGVKEFWLDAR